MKTTRLAMRMTSWMRSPHHHDGMRHLLVLKHWFLLQLEAKRQVEELTARSAADVDDFYATMPADQKAVIADFLDVARHLMQDHLHTLSTKDAR